MSDRRRLVLDNSVISAFASGDWFDTLSFWTPQYELHTTDRIWSHEFTPHHAYSKPEWLQIQEVDTAVIDVKSVELGASDWSLIRLAEILEDSLLVSNDKRLLEETSRRGIDRIWGSKLLLQTFEACGIDREAYERGLSAYIRDVHLPESVSTELKAAEKN